MAKLINLPKPLDAQGKELTPERIEQVNAEPEYFSVVINVNGENLTFFGAADFEQINRDADKKYQLFKSEQYKAFEDESDTPKPKKKVNSKFTNQKPGEDEEESKGRSGFEQFNESVKLQDRLIDVFVDLAFPDPKFEDKVILAHGIPDMPDADDQAALKEWFSNGSPRAKIVINSIIAKYDPTSPLAFFQNVFKSAMASAATQTADTLTEAETEANPETETTGETWTVEANESAASGVASETLQPDGQAEEQATGETEAEANAT